MVKEPASVSTALVEHLRRVIDGAGGWIGFERFQQEALYAPGLGYYARADRLFGQRPEDGSDFVTAPEMSPLFGQALAAQVKQGLDAVGDAQVFEFGAGSGALAEQLLDTLDAAGSGDIRYSIVEVSGALRGQQQRRLARFGERVRWLDAMPPMLRGVVIGNEVLDAMPARLLAFDGARWAERGVAWHEGAFAWGDRTIAEWPPVEQPMPPGSVVEVQPRAQAFVSTVAEALQGLALFIDYGFPQAELYHPQRHAGTLMCHRGHRADGDPLADVGLKDITVHVDFTAMALAAQEAGAEVAGYTSQGRFLLNCGIAPLLAAATLPQRIAAQRLVHEHEMGELFKVLAFTRGVELEPLGFVAGDRMHRL